MPFEDEARAAAREHRAPAVHPQVGRGDARRARGHRRDGRQRDRRPTGAIIPAAVGVDIGCGMMAVRTTSTASRPARRPARAAHGDRGGGARTAAPTTAAATTAARGTTLPAAQRRGVGGSSRRGYAGDRRQAPEARAAATHVQHLGTLGTGNHFIEVCLDEDGPRLVHAALRLARRRQPHRQLLHRARQGGHAPLVHQPAGPRTWRTCPRARSTSTTTWRRCSWAQDFAAHEPRADDGRRRRGAARGAPGCRRSRPTRGGELPPQLRGARAPLRRERARDAQGRGARARGRPRHHPRQHGRALVHRARQGQPGELRELQPRRGPRDVAHRGASGASRSRTTRRRPRASSAARTRT